MDTFWSQGLIQNFCADFLKYNHIYDSAHGEIKGWSLRYNALIDWKGREFELHRPGRIKNRKRIATEA